MKRFLYACLLCSYVISLSACGNESNDTDVLSSYIVSAKVLNKEAGNIAIDNFTRQITVELYKGQDKTDVQIRFELAKGVSMVSPANTESVYNLTGNATVKVSAKGKELSFTIKTKDIELEVPGTYKGWTLTSEFGSLPTGIAVYKSPATLQNKNAVAFIAIADIDQGKTFEILGEATGIKTPTQYYESTGKIYPVIINGGYFWGTSNLSMIVRNGSMVVKNNQVVTRKNAANEDASFYPTRGVFGHIKDKQYITDWVFTTVTPGTTYAYPEPSPNKAGTNPKNVPSATYPAGAWEYKATTAIGGGPVLVKGGVLKNTWEAELYDTASGIGATSNNPRTAIGVTADNKLILFVCEGRNQTPNTPGYTLEETARIMMDLGCIEVLNLDGGGSTCMLVNGKETIKPSDAGNAQRSVISAVVLR